MRRSGKEADREINLVRNEFPFAYIGAADVRIAGGDGKLAAFRVSDRRRGTTAARCHDRLAALGAAAIVAAIAEWQAGRLAPVPQPTDGVTYASKIRKEEARIDWNAPAAAIDRQVRAFNPWPVAETRWEERQLRVWAAEPVSAAAGEPGQVVEASGGRIVVATGEGALRLLRVQLAGRRALTAAEFLNAHSLAGARLG